MKILKLWNYLKEWDNLIVLLISLSMFALLPFIDVARGAMIILFVFLLFGKDKKKTMQSYLSKPCYKLMFWSCLSLYFLYVIGMFYSPDKSSGISELGTYKITILLIPIMFILIPKRLFSEKYQKKYLFSYIVGCLLFLFWSLGQAFIRFFKNPEVSTNTFFKSELALHIHTTYAALFFVMGIVFCCYLLQRIPLSKWQKYALAVIIIFFLGYAILLSSRGGILALVIAIMFIIISFINSKKGIIYGTLSFVIFIAFLIFLGGKIHYLQHRIDSTINAIENFQENSEQQDLRILLWKNTIPVVKERFWFGIGTGGKDIAMSTVRLDDYPELNNPHNQYLQTAIEIGFVGTLSLFLIFTFGLFTGIQNKDYLLIILILIFTINCFFESMLERVQGNTFFMFALFLIMNMLYSKDETEANPSSLGDF